MASNSDLLRFPEGTPGLTDTIRPIDFFDEDMPEELPVFENHQDAGEAVSNLLCEAVDRASRTELEDGFHCTVFCASPYEDMPGFFFGMRTSLNVRGRFLADTPDHPYLYSPEEWRETIKESIRAGMIFADESDGVTLDEDCPFVFTEEVFNHDSFQEFEEMLEGPEWPTPFEESRSLWYGFEANLLMQLRGMLTADDPIILRTLSLDAFLTFVDRWNRPERFVGLVSAGPSQEEPMPRLYSVNEKAWNRWIHKEALLREREGRIIRKIGIDDLLAIFPHKAQIFTRKSGEECFEVLLEGGAWAQGQIRNTIRRRLEHTAFDALTGELLLDEEPTAPEVIFAGIEPGRLTDKDGPEWVLQRRRDRAALREKRHQRIARNH